MSNPRPELMMALAGERMGDLRRRGKGNNLRLSSAGRIAKAWQSFNPSRRVTAERSQHFTLSYEEAEGEIHTCTGH